MTAGTITAYLLQSALFLAIGHLLYKTLLSRMKMPAFNRAVILGIYAIALCAPAFHSAPSSWIAAIPQEEPVLPIAGEPEHLSSGTNAPQTTCIATDYYPDHMKEHPAAPQSEEPTPRAGGHDIWGILFVIGCIGAGVGFMHLLLSLATIIWFGIRSESRSLGHVRLLLLDNERISPFSLLNMIFMPRSDWKQGSDMIISHEMGHIRHLHSLDLLLSRGCLILMWWNPSAWLLNRELRAIHEYQADERVLRDGHEIKDYQLLLIKKATGARLQPIASGLNHSKLKQRFAMMYQQKSSGWAKIRAILLIPAFCGAILLTGQDSVAAFINELSETSFSTEPGTNEIVYDSDSKALQSDEATLPAQSDATEVIGTLVETTAIAANTEKDTPPDAIATTGTTSPAHPTIIITEPDIDDDAAKSVWELDVLKSNPSFIDVKIYDKTAGSPTINGVKVTLDQMDEFLRDNNETEHLKRFREMRRAGKFNNSRSTSDLSRDTFIRTDDENDDAVITIVSGSNDQTVHVTRDGQVKREIDERTKEGTRKLAQEARKQARDKASRQRKSAMEQATDARIRAIESQAQALESQAQALESRAQATNDEKQAAAARKQASKARKEAAKARKSAAKEREKIQRQRKERPDWWNFEVFTPEQKKAMDNMSKQLSEMNTAFAEMDASFAEMNKGLDEMSKNLATTRSITVNGHDIEHYTVSDGKLSGRFVSLNNTNGTNVEVILSSATPIEIGSTTMQVGGKRYKCSIARATKITQGKDQDIRYIVLAKIRAKKLTTFSNKDYVTVITNQGTVKIHLKTT